MERAVYGECPFLYVCRDRGYHCRRDLHAGLLRPDCLDERARLDHQHRRLHQLSWHVQPHLSFVYAGDVECGAGPGWNFSGWSGGCSGTGPCTLTMLGNYGVSAYFMQPGSGLQFSSVTPCRLIDTRQTGQPIQGGTSQDFTVPQLGGCSIPASASAYSLNVTVVPHGRWATSPSGPPVWRSRASRP